MSTINSPIVEYFPYWPVEFGNELFWYIFDGEPEAKDGFIELDENKPGLGITLSEKYLVIRPPKYPRPPVIRIFFKYFPIQSEYHQYSL